MAALGLAACNSADSDTASKSPTSKSSSPTEAGSKPNGVEKRSAAAIYNAAHQANAEAGSFVETRTQPDTKARLALSATECAGTVSKTGLGSYEIIVKGNDVWAKLDAQLAKSVERMAGPGASLPAGTWLHGPSSHGLLKGLASYCHTEQFRTPDTASVKLTKGAATEMNGQPAIPVILDGGNGARVTYYVATTGEPRLLKQASTSKAVPTLAYSDFGKPVGAKAPSGKVVEAPTD
ncbi:hypothetical protein [Streptomyces luteolus]|uniref:Lipoprotein n=1 Tax=Streptomyces luteolus TaxID=3043615 RepID=A0ABT6SSM3_9ACTN|nr:hypothetical protein [Streptomyces sp. B-S-A12]MDI3418603.1 hypothetical protein [Streptomyces sp. B-S-A12]